VTFDLVESSGSN